MGGGEYKKCYRFLPSLNHYLSMTRKHSATASHHMRWIGNFATKTVSNLIAFVISSLWDLNQLNLKNALFSEISYSLFGLFWASKTYCWALIHYGFGHFFKVLLGNLVNKSNHQQVQQL